MLDEGSYPIFIPLNARIEPFRCTPQRSDTFAVVVALREWDDLRKRPIILRKKHFLAFSRKVREFRKIGCWRFDRKGLHEIVNYP